MASPLFPPDVARIAADRIRRRRHELGLTQEQAATSGLTISVATWRQLESGRAAKNRFTGRTLMAVARALHWETGWAERLLASEDPEVVKEDPMDQVPRGRHPNTALARKIGRLSDQDARYVEGVIDTLLREAG
jgi:transcriptional regulator with XRE-family HTH domain